MEGVFTARPHQETYLYGEEKTWLEKPLRLEHISLKLQQKQVIFADLSYFQNEVSCYFHFNIAPIVSDASIMARQILLRANILSRSWGTGSSCRKNWLGKVKWLTVWDLRGRIVAIIKLSTSNATRKIGNGDLLLELPKELKGKGMFVVRGKIDK